MQRLLYASMYTDGPMITEAECARRVMEGVPPISWFMRQQMRMDRGKLSLPQFRALVRVNREPQTSLSEVAEHLGMSLSTVSRIVSGLVDKGLLARKGRKDDRRQMTLTITLKGQEVLENARKNTRAKMTRALEVLAPEQRVNICQGMTALAEVFGTMENSIANQGSGRGSNRSSRSVT